MRSFIYCLQTACRNLTRTKWINLLTILTIAVGLLILGVFTLVTLNMNKAVSRWSKGFGIVVYLNDNISTQERRELRDYFKKDPDVLEVKYISKERALIDLRQTFGSKNPILDGLTENPLPSSFEIKLRQSALNTDTIKKKASYLSSLKGVGDIQYGEKWLSSLSTIIIGLKIVGAILGTIVFVAVAFVTYSTIKILFYARIEEIETLKLLGATRAFIKLPFLMEGIFLGVCGGLAGLLGLFIIYTLSAAKLMEFLPPLSGIIMFLPPEAYAVAPAGGAIFSLIGSFLALGKIKF